MTKKLRTCIVFIFGTSILFLLSQFWLMSTYNDKESIRPDDIDVPVILWWTPFVGNVGRLETCGQVQCYFTQDRTFRSHNFLSSILFYGSSFEIDDLPLPRLGDIDWGLLHEESPRNVPMFTSEVALALFNHSATFSRHSDVPLTTADLDGEEELTGSKYFVPLEEKNRLISETQVAPLLYIQSDCSTASDRDSYVMELMKYIQIDSYASNEETTVHTKYLQLYVCHTEPTEHEFYNEDLLILQRLTHDHVNSLKDSEFLSLTARYKFTLAFENAVCEDYITEKLWRPLVVGSVPVYYGSPSFKDWLPNEKSAISVSDFAGPKELADFLLAVANDDLRYQEYIAHKISTDPSKRITNTFLLNALRSRAKDVPNEFGNYVNAFECLVCQRSYDRKINRHNSYVVTKEHYNCPIPVSPLTNRVDKNNWWVDEWIIGRCRAKLLSHYVFHNTSIDRRIFELEVFMLNLKKDC